jgi:hypothetical protein
MALGHPVQSSQRRQPKANSVVEVAAIDRDEGSTLAFSKPQARKMLDSPSEDTVAGLRESQSSRSACG